MSTNDSDIFSGEGWNRNTHYHERLLGSLPTDCRRVLDVGCGIGTFARRLARVTERVDAVDRDSVALARAEQLSQDVANLHFVEADFLTWQPETTYDAISMIAVLHHLPFEAALMKASKLLRPGGALLVLGLDRSPSFGHYVLSGAIATLLSGWYKMIHPRAPVGAPIAEPQMTLSEIRVECEALLPGAKISRHALLRYSLIWNKP